MYKKSFSVNMRESEPNMKRKINFKRELLACALTEMGMGDRMRCALRSCACLVLREFVIWESKNGQFERAILENEFIKLD